MGDILIYIKNLGISIIKTIISIISFTFFITLLSYFNIINDKICSIFKILIPVISLFIGGFYMGKKSRNKGYLEGLKFGLIFCLLLIIFNLIVFGFTFEIKYILFYIIIIISSTLGSMIGINKAKRN